MVFLLALQYLFHELMHVLNIVFRMVFVSPICTSARNFQKSAGALARILGLDGSKLLQV